MKFREIMKFGAVVFALLGSLLLAHRSADHSAPFDGYCEGSPASPKANLRVWMGNGGDTR